jgi:hypothetical protein
MRLTILLMVVGLVAASCGSDAFPTADAHPPDLLVTSGDQQLTLQAHGYCWSRRNGSETLHVCADGIAPDPLPSLTVSEEAVLSASFPLPWKMTTEFLPGGERCPGAAQTLVDISGGPISVPDALAIYRVELSGRGKEGHGSWASELATVGSGQTRQADTSGC